VARRALLIGSQTGGLAGVHGDVEVMAHVAAGLGFEVRTLTEAAATGAGIRTAYAELVQDCSGDDAALVYYSGHGGRFTNRLREQDPGLPMWLQFIVPTDFDHPNSAEFTGILAEELSVLQQELTERTRNVTTIFDCCHSARMFRAPEVVPRALVERELPWDAVAARWHAVQATGDVAPADANPHAVQLVACAPDQSAYELPSAVLGGTHGALTAALVQVLRSPQADSLSWREAIEVVRPAVLDVVTSQRPDVLGPNAARYLFSLREKDDTGALPVTTAGGAVWIEGAALFGIGEGDTYQLRAPRVQEPLAEAVIEMVSPDRARLVLDPFPPEPLPAGLLAYPVRVSLGRRPVVVSPPEHPDRASVVEALRDSPAVRVAVPSAVGVMATLELDDDGILLLDAAGQPLTSTRRRVDEGGLRLVKAALVTLARATHVRELDSGQGASALPADVELAYTRLDPELGREIPIETGDHLYVGDAVVVRARNKADNTRYVSVLDIGLTGRVAIMTSAEPSGATVVAGEELVVGEDATHALRGIGLYWPEGLPTTGPRPETLVTLVADDAISGLLALQQAGVRTRSVDRGVRSALDVLIEDLSVGTRDAAAVAGATKPSRYRVHRFDFVLHPEQRPSGEREPDFEVDERPHRSMRLITPRSLAPTPEQVSVRLSDVTVLGNRSIFRSRVRVDTLVITSAAADAQAIQAHTFFIDRVKDGDRLPMDNVRIFDGPVGRFLDIAVWVSKADQREAQLADLLAAELHSREVASALTTLAALAVAAPAAAVIAGSVAAVATLVRTGARLLSAYAGTSIGVYRTSLLPHERYGAGQPALRHPVSGSLTAQDLALAYEVIDAGWHA
jgi:Caspase domain